MILFTLCQDKELLSYGKMSKQYDPIFRMLHIVPSQHYSTDSKHR